jgi:iron complex outermembrane receptor protein
LKTTAKAHLLRTTLLAALCVAPGIASNAFAQETTNADDVVIITGTRITAPGVESSSPITSVGAEEIELLQQPEAEKILRLLPMTIPGDGQNVNNGTAGAATVNLRGLGPQRGLLLMNGQRLTPYDFNGRVDTQVIPTALLERVDIVTGGASATYGSDAMSGAINFITKRDFQGVALNVDRSITGEDDGEIISTSLTLGSNLGDGRGNVVMSFNYSDRQGVQGGARPLGRLGIVTASGAGYQNFLNGVAPTPPADPNCQGENAVAAGGSGTTTPTRLELFGVGALGQVRTNGTIGPNCSVFNFNPYNYYQTPQERFGATALGHYTIDEHFEAYGRASFSQVNVTQQVAPSGVFFNSFWTPLANPFLAPAQQQFIIDAAAAALTAGTLLADGTLDGDGVNIGNWRDLDNSGTVTAADDLNLTYGRRTTEFGPRSTNYDSSWFQLVGGLRGEIVPNWDYDVSFSHGESHQTRTNAGYTNVANIANALDAVSTTACRNGDPTCVPLNLFGTGAGITPAMAQYSSATALEDRLYRQDILQGNITGYIDQARTPWATSGLAVSFGAEYREEFGSTTPDECLKLAPASCLGGAGGNILPIAGGFSSYEYYGEAILPIASDMPFAKSLDFEVGYRYADYDPSGGTDTFKYGLSWSPVETLRFRAMIQQAVRAPNVGEIASPITTGLDNAVSDPCSVTNAVALAADATLRARCVSTGMTLAQVGTVTDIQAGQINGFFGTNPNALPEPETADTTTLGMVWTPDFGSDLFQNFTLAIDYYDITIEDYINSAPAQGVLNGCYLLGVQEQCDKIQRVGGNLINDGSGVELLFENLEYITAEGIEVAASFDVDLGAMGDLAVTFNANHYLTNEFSSYSNLPVVDCKGFYSSSCGANFGTPLPETRWIQRTLWNFGAMGQDFQVGYLWRHLGEVESDVPVFAAFQTIDAMDYIDLTGAWNINDNLKLSVGVTNLFEEDPPVVGNEAADTSNNSLNTFPSTYDALGRIFSIGLNARF